MSLVSFFPPSFVLEKEGGGDERAVEYDWLFLECFSALAVGYCITGHGWVKEEVGKRTGRTNTPFFWNSMNRFLETARCVSSCRPEKILRVKKR